MVVVADAAVENPLWKGLRRRRTPEPCTVVIFGATGDLTHRKLMPALYHLAQNGLLSSGFSVVGFARRPWSDDDFRREMVEGVRRFSGENVHRRVWESLADGLSYIPASFDDEAGYEALAERLDLLATSRGTGGNALFYLATPPAAYDEIIKQLGAHGLAGSESGGWRRIIVEKPFGHDLQSAIQLNRIVNRVFSEEQVYRIDHYLGKETVQNVSVVRFANGIFEPLWNHRYVDHVQIAVAEGLGVEGRGAYFEESGLLRDIIQNHALQLLTLVAMEPPVRFMANAVRDEKVKVLQAIRPIDPRSDAVRGQYGPGTIDGQPVPGYREEDGVAADSSVETFVALRLWIDNWRWAGVPFYVRGGKRLPKRVTEIAVQFRAAPPVLFSDGDSSGLDPNVLVLRIQPDEGISLRFGSKLPGPAIDIQSVNMDFRYGTSFGRAAPEAYERLLVDAMLGDSTLFARRDEVEAAWSLLDPILREWASTPAGDRFANYAAGTWGPHEARRVVEEQGHRWRRL
jgi:glucose-6-phosphate 1-dehydrogenase